MESFPLRLSPVGKLCPECTPDVKSRFRQIGNPSVSRAEVICPEPRRATSVPYVLDTVNRFGSKSKGILPVHRGNHALQVLDIILNEDDLDDSDPSNQTGFFCGSPPVRTNNPVVHDDQFGKQTLLLASPLGNHHHGMKPSARLERGSPSCTSPLGASPKLRVEGFACGSPNSRQVVPAFA